MEEMSFNELQEILSVCLDEIVTLKEEKAHLQSQVNVLMQSVEQLLKYHTALQNDFDDKMKNIATSLKLQDRGLENIKYELNDPYADRTGYFYPQFYEIDDTIDKIVHERCSMARFGDGELSIMAGYNRQKFQSYDGILSRRLREVIVVHEEDFVVAIADNYGSLEKYGRAGKSGIRNYMTTEIREEHRKLLEEGRVYHNAYISRPCVLYSDSVGEETKARFDRLKEIWKDRDLIIIEGAQTRMGVGNDLFDSAKSIQRIIGPAEDAFSKYDAILKKALEIGNKDALYLIALGPTAGVLAFDLYKNGYQALDIGHVDLEYEWFLHGDGKRCAVEGKYNNEFVGGEIVAQIHDPAYEKQIVAAIL